MSPRQGTPLIADPGYQLVRDARQADMTSAVSARALRPASPRSRVAGLPTDQFHFAGFLPPQQTARQKSLGGADAPARDIGVIRVSEAAKCAFSGYRISWAAARVNVAVCQRIDQEI